VIVTMNKTADPRPADWAEPTIDKVELFDFGRKIGVVLRYNDGRLEAARITAEQFLKAAA
jgi:hypothetical protein